MKLPGVLIQVALVSQLSVLAAHSSTSDNYTIKCKILEVAIVHTSTVDSIPCVSMVTGTGEAPRSVDTGSISVTVVSVISTLINV